MSTSISEQEEVIAEYLRIHIDRHGFDVIWRRRHQRRLGLIALLISLAVVLLYIA